MKAISVRPGVAIHMLCGYKTIEHRTWPTKHRGEICFCTTAVKEPGTIPGHAMLVADLIDVVPFTADHLDAANMTEMPNPPGYAWILGERYSIVPFPQKGKQGFFSVPDDMIQDLPEHSEHEYFDKLLVNLDEMLKDEQYKTTIYDELDYFSR